MTCVFSSLVLAVPRAVILSKIQPAKTSLDVSSADGE